ncbi:MAG: helix-turn-helix domain-containing protein [Chromatiales bacterium]|nr:helix-turn-helix domain-containing protein [Chromatiales bacterium]MCK7581133.1 helix-turn-helix domain-containing protein [Chromatiales bacterium]
MNQRLYAPNDAAVYLGMSRRSFDAIAVPHLPYIALGSRKRFDRDDLDAWASKQRKLESTLKAAKLLGTDEPMAKAVAVDIVRERVGVDFSPLLIGNTVDEAPMTSTELGREWGLAGKIGEKMNAALLDQGYAVKNENGDWVPTEKGKPYATVNPYKSPYSGHSGYRTLWYRRILDVLTKEEVA